MKEKTRMKYQDLKEQQDKIDKLDNAELDARIVLEETAEYCFWKAIRKKKHEAVLKLAEMLRKYKIASGDEYNGILAEWNDSALRIWNDKVFFYMNEYKEKEDGLQRFARTKKDS